MIDRAFGASVASAELPPGPQRTGLCDSCGETVPHIQFVSDDGCDVRMTQSHLLPECVGRHSSKANRKRFAACSITSSATGSSILRWK
jgi:hypothetical protein